MKVLEPPMTGLRRRNDPQYVSLMTDTHLLTRAQHGEYDYMWVVPLKKMKNWLRAKTFRSKVKNSDMVVRSEPHKIVKYDRKALNKAERK